MRVGSDRAKKATAQLLKQEYANLKFKDGETVEDFSLRLQTLINKLKSHGITIDEEEVVFVGAGPTGYPVRKGEDLV